MRTASQRIAAYEARMLSTLLDPTGAAVTAKAVQGYKDYVDDFYPKSLQTRGILDSLAIPVHWYAAFVRLRRRDVPLVQSLHRRRSGVQRSQARGKMVRSRIPRRRQRRNAEGNRADLRRNRSVRHDARLRRRDHRPPGIRRRQPSSRPTGRPYW